MSINRNASSVIFGFDFQVNAAIVLMLENIKELKTLRLEGESEDIEIKLSDESTILAQAKSIVKSSSDFKNVITNMKKSLKSLSEGSKRLNHVSKLIMITNSPNPLNDKKTLGIFYLNAHRDYESLPDVAKDKIQKLVNNEQIDIDLSKFKIQILPFETDNDVERYKFIKKEIDEFINSIQISNSISQELMSVWQNKIFKNGSKKNVTIKLSKKDIIWPIIVILTDLYRIDNDYLGDLDCALYDEIINQYSSVIEDCSERFDFFTRVLYDYKGFHYKGTNKDKNKLFISSSWSKYKNEFDYLDIDSEIKGELVKVILNNILTIKYKIDNIKSGVNL